MRKLAAIVALATLSPLVSAVDLPPRTILDKVVFQVSAKQWVTTQTALLTVAINATLSNADLVKARADIMSNLTKIATGDWQLTQFDRSQDSSGLEKLYVVAQARIPQAGLTDIYKHAKDVSKPGATYEIGSVEFKPGLAEIQQAKSQLREQLYQQVNNELSRLNKAYATQNYSVNRIIFFDGEPVLPLAKAYFNDQQINTAVMTAAATPAPPVTVSNELVMGAVVELASNRQEGSAVANN
ncbi:hypothetical protein [Legionella fairfieldensis]|uniref:hypothetical protein n=1 Tax=Legionella fairfieldensis TaxID=45064 RepID=UPI00048CE70B|nr:hypothetical protein [Legionella fairfieldensis]